MIAPGNNGPTSGTANIDDADSGKAAKQALELMGKWEMIDVCDALELLSLVFESEEMKLSTVMPCPSSALIEWFFHRLKVGRPIPIPSSGLQITQLGHVKDLAKAFIHVLGNEKANKEVFNISREKYVMFDGLARACAKVDVPTEILMNLQDYYAMYLSYSH
ncbi:hypothetical protein JHK87_031408 [Glycine soja]|nr:hypothetical protein JHK87_031408 [Glycine soja]